MPDAVFVERPGFGASVANRSVGAPPPGRQPTGPRGFPCSTLCPPPPAVPLAVVSVVAEEWFSLQTVVMTFDAPPVLSAIPNWGWTGGDAAQLIGVGSAGPNTARLVFDMIVPTAFVVPANATGVLSASGGAVVPGTYPVV